MKNFYIEQHEGFALGNFIALTPTIKFLSDFLQKKIPVKFNTEYVKQCYLDSPYIDIIDDVSLHGRRLFGSELICRRNYETDYEFVFKHACFIFQIDASKETIPIPFIDMPFLKESTFELYKNILNQSYGVFINGSGSEKAEYLDRKLIDGHTQRIILNHAKIPIIGTGSLNDAERNIFNGPYGNIRESLAIIKNAEFIISNVTGFYHVAGAMQKKQLVLRKNCLFPRCSNINPNQSISLVGNWNYDIIEFLKNN
jgi:hypothetical protein